MPITQIFLLTAASFAMGANSCPPATGDPNGNYMSAGSLGDVEYGGGMTLDAYAPEGKPKPFAVLIHGSSGDKSTHMTQLFAVLERAGYSWFSVDYRNAEDIRAAIRYIRCPGRFNLNQHMVLIAEDTGADLAAEVGAERLILFGAKFDRKPVPVDAP